MKNPVISPPVASGINRLPTPPGEEHLLTFGGSRLWILRRESGWGLALEPPELLGAGQLSGDVLGGSFSYTAAPKPAELPWASYYVEDEEDSLLVELVLPNRPVAAHPPGTDSAPRRRVGLFYDTHSPCICGWFRPPGVGN